MRALVTGGVGFIGAALVERLLVEGHAVDVVDDLSTGSLVNLADARADRRNRLRIHRLDVRDPELPELIVRCHPDVVFHLAALTDPATVAEQPTTDAEVTVVGSLRVLEGTVAAGAGKVVYVANASVFGNPPADDLPVDEGAVTAVRRPCPPTGIARRAVIDQLAWYRSRHGVEFTAAVLGTVYGPGHAPQPGAGVVASFVRRLLAGKSCVVHGEGTQTVDLVFIDDAVDALARAATRGDGLVINVGTGVETAINDLYRLVSAELGTDLPVHVGGPRPNTPARIALDPTRAGIQLGWEPWTDVATGVRAVVRHHVAALRRG